MKVILSAALVLGVVVASNAAFAAPPFAHGRHCTTIVKRTVHHGHVVVTRNRVCR